jgi:hypothetical protein
MNELLVLQIDKKKIKKKLKMRTCDFLLRYKKKIIF